MKNSHFWQYSLSPFGNAQITKVLEFNDSKLFPIYGKHRLKVWKNMVFYQGKGIPYLHLINTVRAIL